MNYGNHQPSKDNTSGNGSGPPAAEYAENIVISGSRKHKHQRAIVVSSNRQSKYSPKNADLPRQDPSFHHKVTVSISSEIPIHTGDLTASIQSLNYRQPV